MANLVASFVHHSQRKKNNPKLIIGKVITVMPFSGDFLNPIESLTFGTSQCYSGIMAKKTIYKLSILQWTYVIQYVRANMEKYEPHRATGHKATSWRLKCFINSGMSGLIPERRYWIAFFPLSTSKSSVSQKKNDTVYKRASLDFILFLSQTSRVFSVKLQIKRISRRLGLTHSHW